MTEMSADIRIAAAQMRDAERWEAVENRDKAFDDRFIYGVKTTGIYCRPSCGSKAARRENVVVSVR